MDPFEMLSKRSLIPLAQFSKRVLSERVQPICFIYSLKCDYRWSYALTEEFFRQGDMEKELGLPCSNLCDRNTVLVSQSQLGFLRFIIQPTFKTLIDLFK